MEFKIGTKFSVSDFMKMVDMDFLYNYDEDQDKYFMLNDQIYGEVDKSIVEKQKKTNKVVVINTKALKLYSYNINEDELVNAMMNF